jgi:hypothetical protein
MFLLSKAAKVRPPGPKSPSSILPKSSLTDEEGEVPRPASERKKETEEGKSEGRQVEVMESD